MCQFLHGEFFLAEPRGQDGFDVVKGAFEWTICSRMIGESAGDGWAQQPVVCAGEEQGRAESERGDPVSEAIGNSLDNAMKAQSAKLIGHGALGDIAGIFAGQGGEVLAQIGGAEAVGLEAEKNDRLPDELVAWIGEAQARCALTILFDGAIELLKAVLGEDAIMAEPFDFQKTAVGCKAKLTQFGQICRAACRCRNRGCC